MYYIQFRIIHDEIFQRSDVEIVNVTQQDPKNPMCIKLSSAQLCQVLNEESNLCIQFVYTRHIQYPTRVDLLYEDDSIDDRYEDDIYDLDELFGELWENYHNYDSE